MPRELTEEEKAAMAGLKGRIAEYAEEQIPETEPEPTLTVDDKIRNESIAREAERQQYQYPSEYAERRAQMARLRAYRSNMFRKLKKHFKINEPFTSSRAAQATGTEIDYLVSYLESEIHRPGSHIVKLAEGEYYIKNPFLEI